MKANRGGRWFLGLALLALVAGQATDARAVSGSCGGGIDPTITPVPPAADGATFVGDKVKITLAVSTGGLQGNTTMTIQKFLYAPDCPNDGTFTEPTPGNKVPCANAHATQFKFVPGTESLTAGCGVDANGNPPTVSCFETTTGPALTHVLTSTPTPPTVLPPPTPA